MDTHTDGHILYAGQRLPATFVSEINLWRYEGMDTLVRDRAGHYYLHRLVYRDQQGRRLPGDTFVGRCKERSHHSLHRLSHAAMALWMIETSGGDRQVRRDAASLWGSAKEPTASTAETLPLVPLGPQATHVLASLCRRYQVERESVLQSVVEQFLADACEDASLASCVAEEARAISRVGAVPVSWWEDVALELPGTSKREVNA